MATKLTKPVQRETSNTYRGRPIILTIAPGPTGETILGMRRKGERTEYLMLLSDAYRISAMRHGTAEKAAKKSARRAGIPWKQAKREFLRGRRISL